MALEERAAWVSAQGWYYEIFETANNTICLQAWVWEREMREWEYSLDGQTEINKNTCTAY